MLHFIFDKGKHRIGFVLRGLHNELILQVHDELIVETPEDKADAVLALVRNEMEHACELSVPLNVEAKAGKTWADAH